MMLYDVIPTNDSMDEILIVTDLTKATLLVQFIVLLILTFGFVD